MLVALAHAAVLAEVEHGMSHEKRQIHVKLMLHIANKRVSKDQLAKQLEQAADIIKSVYR